ncbi:MAG: type 1 glutamine amidotransferase [Myxococcota bacterium]|nr:type 1 glutamine amidotransferase [Myxococcota bacterium]
MKRILVFQHVPYEPLGTLDPLLKKAGFRIRYVNFSREPKANPSIEKYDGVVALGGPMNVGQVEDYPHLATEIRVLQKCIANEMPILGICLGAQLLSKALGGKVTPNPQREVGWYDVTLTEEGQKDPLLKHLEVSHPIFQWHGDTFSIPPGATHLATTSTCTNQAFRYKDNIYGFQFHLEVDQSLIGRWLNTPRYVEEMKSCNSCKTPEEIIATTEKNIVAATDLSLKVFGAFIDLFGFTKQFRSVSSK